MHNVVYYLKVQEVYINYEAFYVNINPDLSHFLSLFISKQIWRCRQTHLEQAAAMPSRAYSPFGPEWWKKSGILPWYGFLLAFFKICFLTWIKYNTAFFKTNPKKSLIENWSQQCSISKRVHLGSLMRILNVIMSSPLMHFRTVSEGFPCARASSCSHQENYETGWGCEGKSSRAESTQSI